MKFQKYDIKAFAHGILNSLAVKSSLDTLRKGADNMDTFLEQNSEGELYSDEKLARQESVPDFIPEWLTIDLIQDTLKKYFQSNEIRVDRIIVNNCGGCGESYASMMFRVVAHYQHNSLKDVKSIIIKTLPQNEMALEKLGEEHFNVQNKEMTFYEKLIPEVEKILKDIGEDEKTFPKVMAVYRNIDVIVLEDLREKRFVMADRLKGLDLAHMKLSLSGLAKIHAASLILKDKDADAFKAFDIGFYNRKTRAFDAMFISNLRVFSEEVATWKDWTESDYYATKLRNFQESLIENGCKVFDFNKNDLNVFNHGDLWTNNLLFSYDGSNVPTKAVILDFQYSFFGSASLDLLYFLFTSLQDHLRIDRMEELVQFYYYELKDLLRRLNYNLDKFPSLHSFQIEYLRKYFYGFSACLLTVPIMINQEKDANFEALMSLDEHGMDFKRRIYRSPRIKKIAIETLPIFNRRGIFDEF